MTIRSGTSNYGSIYFSDATSGSGEYAGVLEYSHATDHLAFYTAATQRLRIDSSGRLLVNTSTSRIVEDHVGNGPQGKIQIEAANSDAIMSIISAGTADANRCGTLSLGRHRNSTVGATPTIVQNGDSLGAIVFAAGDGTDMRTSGAKIHAIVNGTPGSNDMPGALIFSTTPDGSSNSYNGERMRINSSGVGIGNTDPGALLHVSTSSGNGVIRAGGNNAGTTGFDINHSNTSFTTTTLKTNYRATNGNAALRIDTGTFVVATGTANGEKLRVQANGNVGIGSSNPATKLVVSNSGAEGWELGSTSGTVEIVGYNRSTSARSPMKIIGQTFLVQTGNPSLVDGLYQDSSGRVGIGNSNPGGYNSIMDDLVVGNHTGAHGITICAQNNNYGSLTFADGTSGSAEQRAGRVAYHHSTNTMRFYTTNSERLRIDSSGRLLLGTTDTSSIASAIIQGNSSGTDSYGLLRLAKGSTTPADGDTLGLLAFGDSNHATAAQISCQRDGGTWTSGSSHPTRLVFKTAPNGSSGASTRMIIDSAGQTVFNYASALGGGILSLAFNGASQNGFVMQNTGSGSGNAIVFRNNSSSMVGNIVISSSATAYNTSSDYRLKENVVDINDGITRLKQLQPKRFNFIIDADTTIDGFIAHEAQTVVPEAVTGTKDEVDKDGEAIFQGIDQSKLVPLLTAALQEAIAKIETLETKVAALEAA